MTMLGAKYIDFDVVIDVGANKGEYIKRFLRAFPKAQIYAFEPLKEEFSRLQKLFKNKNMHLYNLALGNKIAKMRFYQHLDDTGMSSFHQTTLYAHNSWKKMPLRQKTIQVNVSTLDQIFQGMIEPGQKILVKVDAQGYEKKIIEGGKQTLRQATACVFEICFAKLYVNQPSFDDIYQAMHKLGYEYVGSWNQTPLDKGPLEHIDAFFVKKDYLKSAQYCELQKQVNSPES